MNYVSDATPLGKCNCGGTSTLRPMLPLLIAINYNVGHRVCWGHVSRCGGEIKIKREYKERYHFSGFLRSN